MEFFENELFHIYNRGNNCQPIFFNNENYLFFLRKIRKYILPHCDIICYCLMPNHFHFLIAADNRSIQTKKIGGTEKNLLSEGFKNLLSSYAQAINKQNSTTGSLFQQNTKAKFLSSQDNSLIAFHYIHQNSIKAGLSKKMEDLDFSSFKDYIGQRNGTLCNIGLGTSLLDLNLKTLYQDSYDIIIDDTTLNNIF